MNPTNGNAIPVAAKIEIVLTKDGRTLASGSVPNRTILHGMMGCALADLDRMFLDKEAARQKGEEVLVAPADFAVPRNDPRE